MSTFDLAMKYYPRFWDKKRIDDLVNAGRLTEDEADEIISSKENSPETEPTE